MKSSGNISLSCLREGSGIIVALIFLDVSQRRASFQVETASRFLPLSASGIHQTAKVSILIETTLKQLGVLSEMVWLMSKPNKSSKSLKANIGAWTSSAVSVNLSLSELQPNQIQILRSRHESRHRYVYGHARVCSHARGNAMHAGFVGQFGVHVLLLTDVLGDAERQSRAWAPPLLLCLPWWFPDASEWSECYGTLGKQPSSLGLEPGGQNFFQELILEKTWVCFVITV